MQAGYTCCTSGDETCVGSSGRHLCRETDQPSQVKWLCLWTLRLWRVECSVTMCLLCSLARSAIQRSCPHWETTECEPCDVLRISHLKVCLAAGREDLPSSRYGRGFIVLESRPPRKRRISWIKSLKPHSVVLSVSELFLKWGKYLGTAFGKNVLQFGFCFGHQWYKLWTKHESVHRAKIGAPYRNREPRHERRLHVNQRLG